MIAWFKAGISLAIGRVVGELAMTVAAVAFIVALWLLIFGIAWVKTKWNRRKK